MPLAKGPKRLMLSTREKGTFGRLNGILSARACASYLAASSSTEVSAATGKSRDYEGIFKIAYPLAEPTVGLPKTTDPRNGGLVRSGSPSHAIRNTATPQVEGYDTAQARLFIRQLLQVARLPEFSYPVGQEQLDIDCSPRLQNGRFVNVKPL